MTPEEKEEYLEHINAYYKDFINKNENVDIPKEKNINISIYKVVETNFDINNKNFSAHVYMFISKKKAIKKANQMVKTILKENRDMKNIKILKSKAKCEIENTYHGDYIIEIIKDNIIENENGCINETIVNAYSGVWKL